MTTERAMRLAEKWSNGLVCSVRDGEAEEYHRMFLEMLRAQQEAKKNEPLTLGELREMPGEPYWHVGLQEDSPPPHWTILDAHFAQHLEDYHYGECWLAYRRKPEEVTE